MLHICNLKIWRKIEVNKKKIKGIINLVFLSMVRDEDVVKYIKYFNINRRYNAPYIVCQIIQSMTFYCEICHKFYASYASRWLHRRKYHGGNETAVAPETSKMHTDVESKKEDLGEDIYKSDTSDDEEDDNDDDTESTVSKVSTSTVSTLSTVSTVSVVRKRAPLAIPTEDAVDGEVHFTVAGAPIDHELVCKHCNKSFTRSDNRHRHDKLCKAKETYEQQLKAENFLLKQELNEIKKQLLTNINKNCKVHPRTLTKINKQLIHNNNCHNTNHNQIITNNNNYNIIQFGREELSMIFSHKEKLEVLNKGFASLDFLVEYTHFNDKYPQFKNILITNTQNDLAYKYNSETLQFDAVKKDDLLEEIVSERMYNINEFLEEFNDALSDRTKDNITNFIENMKDKNYEQWKKKDIKLIIYNNRNNVGYSTTTTSTTSSTTTAMLPEVVESLMTSSS